MPHFHFGIAILLGLLPASFLPGSPLTCAAERDDNGRGETPRKVHVHHSLAHLTPRDYGRRTPRKKKPRKKKKKPQKKKKPPRRPAKKPSRPAKQPSRPDKRPRPTGKGKPKPKPSPRPTPMPNSKSPGRGDNADEKKSKDDRPKPKPIPRPTPRPNAKNPGRGDNKDENKNKSKDTNKSKGKPSSKNSGNPTAQRTLDRIAAEADYIDNELFLYETPARQWLPSTIYQHDGLAKGLAIMNRQGVAGMFYYLGAEQEGEQGSRYGLTNVAAFLAQSMKETIKYDACSENSWDLFGGYPLSNSCGQLGQSYQDYHCPVGEEHMECPVDNKMEITATTHAKWYGAPAPLFCRPKKNEDDFTGKWNHGYSCNVGWTDPPKFCDVYEGQKAGGFDNSVPVPNRGGRTDTEGCCWWGRGVIQTTGICNFGKLNFYLGSRAAKEGRDTPYADVDFCKNPEIICSSKKHTELKWIAGMFYWMESVQKYDIRGWNYMDELHKFVDGGFQDFGFIDGVSGIVNRGCHDPPCGTGAVDGGSERKNNFKKALGAFKLLASSKKTGPSGGAGTGSGSGFGSGSGSLVLACGADHQSAAEKCKTCAHSIDCPAGQYCWNGVAC